MTTELPDEEPVAVPEPAPAPRRGTKRSRTEGVPEWWGEAMAMTGEKALYSPAKLAEKYYEHVTIIALDCGNDPAYAWLMPPEERDWKVSLLVELGRFGDEATIRDLATQLCATRPKVREALASLRRRRLGGEAPPPRPLAEAIVRLVEAHLGRYPATSSQMARDALARAAVLLDGRLTECDQDWGPED